MRIGIVLVTYARDPEPLWDSIAGTEHDVTWRIHHHGDDPVLEDKLRQFSWSANAVLRLHHVNRGLSRSWNDGLEASFASGDDHTLLINDDLHFYPGEFDAFIAFLDRHRGYGIATLNGFEPEHDLVREQGAACCAIGGRAIDSIGFFDENIGPAYCEDSDYWTRARLAGVPIIEDSRVLVEHDRSTTYRSSPPEERRRIDSRHEANRTYFYRKWGSGIADIKYRNPFNDSRFGLMIDGATRNAPYGPPYDRLDWQFAENMAHVQTVGDVWTPAGDWCGKPGGGLWLEGVLLAAHDGVDPADLECAAVFEGNECSEWRACGEFLGSRGENAPLKDIRLRLAGSAAETHELNGAATFVGGDTVGPIKGSELVFAAEGRAPVEAFRYRVKKRE